MHAEKEHVNTTSRNSLSEQQEEALICGILRRPADYFEAADWVNASDFANKAYSTLFAAIGEMTKEGLDLGQSRVLANEIIRRGLAERVGGMAELARLIADAVPGHVRYYAEQVAKQSQRRRVIDVLLKLNSAVMDAEFEPSEIAAMSQKMLADAAEDRGSDVVLVGDAMEQYVQKLEQSRESGVLPCLPTGFNYLDQMLGGGIPNGTYGIIAARPSIGKSALAVEIANRVANAGHPALFISLEMTNEQLSQRLITQRTSVTQPQTMTASYTDEQLLEMMRAVAEAKGTQLSIWQASGATIARIEAKIRSEVTRRGVKLVIVDYIGLIEGDRRQKNWERVSEISKDISRICKQLNISIVALCQLSRDAEGELPKLSHLRDSGNIEQDADIVMMIHRDTRDATEAAVLIEKVRQGTVGRVPLIFDKGKFRDVSDATFDYKGDF